MVLWFGRKTIIYVCLLIVLIYGIYVIQRNLKETDFLLNGYMNRSRKEIMNLFKKDLISLIMVMLVHLKFLVQVLNFR